MCEGSSHSIIVGVQQEELYDYIDACRWSFDSVAPTVALGWPSATRRRWFGVWPLWTTAPSLDGPVLLALMDGEAVAALALLDRRVVANPFLCTRDVVQLLRLRAEHIAGPGPGPRRRPALLRRAA